jgi:uncharacterized damage-inducible protein DinB
MEMLGAVRAGYTVAMNNETGKLFLDYSVRKLTQMTGNVDACLKHLTDEQVWRRNAPHENTIGNLVVHLCGNMRQWIMHGVGGQPDVRTRAAEFSASEGLSVKQLSELFRTTVEEAKGVIASLPPEKLLNRTDPQKMGEVSVLDAIYQVVGHVQQHVGQIILLTKQLAATDLDLTIPRPR